jgi:hypothetical protein
MMSQRIFSSALIQLFLSLFTDALTMSKLHTEELSSTMMEKEIIVASFE